MNEYFLNPASVFILLVWFKDRLESQKKTLGAKHIFKKKSLTNWYFFQHMKAAQTLNMQQPKLHLSQHGVGELADLLHVLGADV